MNLFEIVVLIAVVISIVLFIARTTQIGKRVSLRVAGTADEAIQKDAATLRELKLIITLLLKRKKMNFSRKM